MPVGVVIPSHGRGEELRVCLSALGDQQVRPVDVVVARRRDDNRTAKVVREFRDAGVREAIVDCAGLTAALLAGARASRGEIVAFTDDDAIPPPDWVRRLGTAFRDPGLGGIGGSDRPSDHASASDDTRVGCLTAWGKLIGNHDLVHSGPPREVLILKGVNMAYRRDALRLPRGFRGLGAQPHSEVAIGLWLRRAGWRLVFDPSLQVRHRLAGAGRADRESPKWIQDGAYNLMGSMLAVRPMLGLRRVAFGIFVGDRAYPGLGRAVVAELRGEPGIVRRVGPSLLGQVSALWSFARGRGVKMVAVAD